MNEMTTTRPRRQFGAEDRERWIALYERSGKSVREFCHEDAAGAMCQSSLSRWLREKRAAGDGEHRAGSLVEVRAAPAVTADATVAARVYLPGGVTIEVGDGTDARWLASVLRALQPARV